MSHQIPFIIASQDENTFRILNSIILKIFNDVRVLQEQEGSSACELIAKFKTPAIVIVDEMLPIINGVQLVRKFRSIEAYNDFYFIIVNEHSDREANLKELQTGIDDFISKPFSVDEIFSKFRSAHRNVSLKLEIINKSKKIKELDEYLKSDIEKLKNILMKFQEIHIQNAKGIIDRISSAATWISSQESFAESVDIESISIASSLCFIGKLGLPESMVMKPVLINGYVQNPMMNNVPNYVTEFLDKIRGYEEVHNILFHLYENFDGSGIPDKLKSTQIPFGSRLLRIFVDYEEALPMNNGHSVRAIEMLEKESRRLYDFTLLAFFEQYLGFLNTKGKIPSEDTVEKHELIAGMRISRGIITASGYKIVSSGVRLDDEIIDKIKSMTAEDPIIGKIYISKV